MTRIPTRVTCRILATCIVLIAIIVVVEIGLYNFKRSIFEDTVLPALFGIIVIGVFAIAYLFYEVEQR